MSLPTGLTVTDWIAALRDTGISEAQIESILERLWTNVDERGFYASRRVEAPILTVVATRDAESKAERAEDEATLEEIETSKRLITTAIGKRGPQDFSTASKLTLVAASLQRGGEQDVS